MKIEYVPASKPDTLDRPIELFGKTYLFSRDENNKCVCDVEEREAIARLLSIEGYKAVDGEELPDDLEPDDVELEDLDAEQLVDLALNNFGVQLDADNEQEVLLDYIDNLIDVAAQLEEEGVVDGVELKEKLIAAHLEFVEQQKELESDDSDNEEDDNETDVAEADSNNSAASADNIPADGGDESTDLGEWSPLEELDIETITKDNMVSFAEAVIGLEGFGALKADDQKLALEKECLEDFEHNLNRKKSVLNLIKEYAGLIVNAAQ